MSQPSFDIDPDVDARRKERAIEYGTWECGDQPITMGGARAFNEGDPVPKSTVERFGLDKLGVVVPAGTFAKKSADAEAERQAAVDEEIKARLAEAAAARKSSSNTAAKGGGN